MRLELVGLLAIDDTVLQASDPLSPGALGQKRNNKPFK